MNKIKKVAIIVPPLRSEVSFYPPFGALSVLQYIEDDYSALIFDFDAFRCSIWDQMDIM